MDIYYTQIMIVMHPGGQQVYHTPVGNIKKSHKTNKTFFVR